MACVGKLGILVWVELRGCGRLGMDHGGPCKLVRSWVELYPEGDERTVGSRSDQIYKILDAGRTEWNEGTGGAEAVPFRLAGLSIEETVRTWMSDGRGRKK